MDSFDNARDVDDVNKISFQTVLLDTNFDNLNTAVGDLKRNIQGMTNEGRANLGFDRLNNPQVAMHLRDNDIEALREQGYSAQQIEDIKKTDQKYEAENKARIDEIKALDGWAHQENDARKTEIANLDNFAHSENDARKADIAAINEFAKNENDSRKADIDALNQRCDAEASARDTEDKLINERIEKEIRDREQAVSELQSRMDSQNDDKVFYLRSLDTRAIHFHIKAREIEELRNRMMKENMFLNSLHNKNMSVYFNAYR